MKAARSIAAALPSAPTRSLRTTLVRRAPLSPLIKLGTVDYLFMSGRASRFNTAGVKCVYFAEDEATAAAEYERYTRPLRQPFATFFADVELAAVLDLCCAGTLKALGLTVRDLQANWVRAKRPTATQFLKCLGSHLKILHLWEPMGFSLDKLVGRGGFSGGCAHDSPWPLVFASKAPA